MIQLTDKHWAVEVPDYSIEIEVCNYGLNDALEYWYPVNGSAMHEVTDLPPGTWRFLFTTKGATEEDARKVVESSEWHFPARHKRYVDYGLPYGIDNKQKWGEGFGTAKESLRSLLRSKGLEGVWAVVEKKG